MSNGSERTAIARKSMSVPARFLQRQCCLEAPILDYGCGRGKDAEELGCDRYDPFYAPDKPAGKYQTVLCTYVLNVVAEAEARSILADIQKLLTRNGRAYLTVRRDLKEWRGLQRRVELDLPVLHEDSRFCTYVLRGDERCRS
jgi:2-polyprenyl-3-methyl-5-hydroxy-6-metoxy-1,4-benzoquinol methylase